jgi:type IV secretion system protein VirB9
MMRKSALALVFFMCASSFAVAETKPVSLGSDPRIKMYPYLENTVYRLNVYMRFITALQFEQNENIMSVQVGDSASWEIVRLNRGDVLSIKPLIENAFTNMTVYTDQRVYTFELRASSAPVGSAELNYRISFRYPEKEAQGKLAQATWPLRLTNSDYRVAGDARFKPISVYDDGQSTYFIFDDDAPRPAVFRVTAFGAERVENTYQDGNKIVVKKVSSRWTLRIGDEELCVAHAEVAQSVPTSKVERVER